MEQLLGRLLLLRAERVAPSLPSGETELLLRINQGLTEQEARRYRELIERRRAEILTPSEHAELLRLTEREEAMQAERVRYLAELARLRGASLRAVVEELGLRPAPDA